MQNICWPTEIGSGALALQIRAKRSAGLIASLTKRQQNVLQGMVEGLLNKQIAVLLSISEKTVKMHRAALLERLAVSSSACAVRIAVEASFAEAFALPILEYGALRPAAPTGQCLTRQQSAIRQLGEYQSRKPLQAKQAHHF
jgi:DNA-binding CsgD family transcriptional regulator